MNQLTVEVVGGLIVILISGLGGFLLKSRFFQRTSILPSIGRSEETKLYKHMDGEWNLYWLSYHPADSSKPYWFHGKQTLNISKNLVTGSTKFDDKSPMAGLTSKLQGEIRAGKMIVLDVCVQDETEFASVIYPNLRSDQLLVGTWNGLDNLLRPIAAPAILSRKELTDEQLNEALSRSTLVVIPIDRFSSLPDFADVHVEIEDQPTA